MWVKVCNLHGALWCRLHTFTLNTFEYQALKLSTKALCILPQVYVIYRCPYYWIRSNLKKCWNPNSKTLLRNEKIKKSRRKTQTERGKAQYFTLAPYFSCNNRLTGRTEVNKCNNSNSHPENQQYLWTFAYYFVS